MRKMGAWLMAALLLCTGCSDRNVDYYESAQRYLGCGEYDAAAYIFEQLGEYRDAGEYALYTRALEAMAAGDYALAQTNFELVEPFNELSKRTRVNKSRLLDEAIEDLLKKYEKRMKEDA